MPKKPQPPEIPLTTKEAAAHLGVSIARIKQFVADGRLPRRVMGNNDRLVYFRAELDAVDRSSEGRRKKSENNSD